MFYYGSKKGKGFTLIELLVVISIIALLVSILMPSLNRAKDNAKRTVCASNLKSIGQAIMMYAGDNGDKLPRNMDALNDSSPLANQEYNETGEGSPHRSYMMFDIAGNRSLSIKPWDRIKYRYGMGYLMKKYIDIPETFYCEGIPRKRQGGSGDEFSLAFRFDDYDAIGGYPWSPDDMINNNLIRSSFNYIPQSRKKKVAVALDVPGSSYDMTQAQADGGVFKGGVEYFPEIATSTSELYGDYSIVSGLIHNIAFLPHRMGSGKNAASGINVLFGDCSVRFGNDLRAAQSDLWDTENLGVHEYAVRKLISLFEK